MMMHIGICILLLCQCINGDESSCLRSLKKSVTIDPSQPSIIKDGIHIDKVLFRENNYMRMSVDSWDLDVNNNPSSLEIEISSHNKQTISCKVPLIPTPDTVISTSFLLYITNDYQMCKVVEYNEYSTDDNHSVYLFISDQDQTSFNTNSITLFYYDCVESTSNDKSDSRRRLLDECDTCTCGYDASEYVCTCTVNKGCVGKQITCANDADCRVECITINEACKQSTIICPTDKGCSVNCGDNGACNSATIQWPSTAYGTITCGGGRYACMFIHFPIPPPYEDFSFDCNSQNECAGSHIYCPEYANCHITCSATKACSGTTIHWSTNDVISTLSCTFGGDECDSTNVPPTGSPTKSPIPVPTPAPTAPTALPTSAPTSPTNSPTTARPTTATPTVTPITATPTTATATTPCDLSNPPTCGCSTDDTTNCELLQSRLITWFPFLDSETMVCNDNQGICTATCYSADERCEFLSVIYSGNIYQCSSEKICLEETLTDLYRLTLDGDFKALISYLNLYEPDVELNEWALNIIEYLMDDMFQNFIVEILDVWSGSVLIDYSITYASKYENVTNLALNNIDYKIKNDPNIVIGDNSFQVISNEFIIVAADESISPRKGCIISISIAFFFICFNL